MAVIDHHPVVRASLCALLARRERFQVVSDAGDLAGARAVLDEFAPDVLVLDVDLPDALAPEAVSELADDCRVVVLADGCVSDEARDTIRAGAAGFVLKESPSIYLEEAILAAARGRAYVDPQMGARLAREDVCTGEPAETVLTQREVQVLRLVALGNTSKEIARELFLSVRTVETHRARIKRKLRIRGRAELVRYASEHGVLDGAGPGAAAGV